MHKVPDQRPEFGHFCGGCFQASQRQYPYGDRSHRRSSDPLHLPVLPEILCQRYRGRRCERLIQKFEKTVVVFKKSLYNRVVAKAATLFVYNSSEHKQNEKTGYANWFAIGWIVILWWAERPSASDKSCECSDSACNARVWSLMIWTFWIIL